MTRLPAWTFAGCLLAALAGADDVGFLRVGGGLYSDSAAGFASLSFGRDSRLYTVRLSGTEEFELFGPQPGESTQDVGVLIGVRSHDAFGSVSASVGLGGVRSVRRGPLVRKGYGFVNQRLEGYTLGVPLEVSAALHGQSFGLGLTLFGNLNARWSFVGLAVVLHAGQLR